MTLDPVQLGVFLFLTGLIAFVTYIKCKDQPRVADSNRDYFLAGGGLSWIFVAGSITLTNLSTDQLVGMNGSQMLLVALWELSAVVGLFILAGIFIPIYYKYKCTTTTELLERRYNNKHIRATISLLFLAANVFVFIPAVLYTGSKFMLTVFDFDFPLIYIAIAFAALGAAYSIFGGLRAVAVSDTFSGVLLLGLALLVVYLALKAINFDFSGIPKERLTLIGDNDSDIPWHTLLTGMLLIQTFYWSTNQVITQRAMASPTVREAQKGVIAAALIRLVIVPPIIVIPGIVAFKLFNGVVENDGAYGMVVAKLLPPWLIGAFAAAITAAVLTSFNSMLNSSVALYVCDIHEKYFAEDPNVPKLSAGITITFTLIALLLVPIYADSERIINTLQQLWGIFSMPILSAFVVGLIFKNVNAKAAIIAVLFGTLLYGFFLFDINFKDLYLSLTQEDFEAAKGSVGWGTEVFRFVMSPFTDSNEQMRLPHYIHLMFINFFICIGVALFVNRFIFGQKAEFVLGQPLIAEGETA